MDGSEQKHSASGTALGRQLRALYDPVLYEPLPDTLVELLEGRRDAGDAPWDGE